MDDTARGHVPAPGAAQPSADLAQDAGVGARVRLRRRTARPLALLLLAGTAALTLVAGRLGGLLVGRGLLLAVVLAWAACGVGAALLLAARPAASARRDGALVLAVAAGLQALALTSGPQLSDDLYRYVWDGTVAAAGIDPYAFPPAAPELARLRRPFLWPAPERCARDRDARPRGDRADPFASRSTPVDCTRLNRPTVRTIYPPVAQLAFRGLAAVTGGSGGELAVQVPAALLSLALTGLLVALLRRARRPPGWALLYAATPLAGLEAGMDGHVDVLAGLFGVAALGIAARAPAAGRAAGRRRGAGLRQGALVGILLAAATLVKLYPAALAAAALPRLGLLTRRAAAAVAAGGAFAVAAYAPHVRAVGREVLGYLPGYLRENDYGSGDRYLLLRHLLPPELAAPAAGLLLAGIVAVAVARAPRTGDVAALAAAATALVGSAFLVLTPGNAWYGVLLVACAALAGRPEWWAVVVANYVVYVDAVLRAGTPWPTLSYAAAAALAAGAALRRRRTAGF